MDGNDNSMNETAPVQTGDIGEGNNKRTSVMREQEEYKKGSTFFRRDLSSRTTGSLEGTSTVIQFSALMEDEEISALSSSQRSSADRLGDKPESSALRSSSAENDCVTVSSSNSLEPGAVRVDILGGEVSYRQVLPPVSRGDQSHRGTIRSRGAAGGDASISSARAPSEINASPAQPRWSNEDPLVSAVLVNEDAHQNTSASIEAATATPIPTGFVLMKRDSLVGQPKRCTRLWIFLIFVCCVAVFTAVVAVLATKRNKKTAPEIPNKLTGITRAERYWDCSGGACGCASVPTGDHNKPLYCHGNAMFQAPAENEWNATFYGTAAVSEDLGGDWWLAPGCGKCWKLTGTSNTGNDNSRTSTLVVKATNFCPPDKCGPENSFKIAAPGFESTPESLFSMCAEIEDPENVEALTASCIGWMTGNSTDPSKNCDCNMFSNPVLREGCENFLSLGWDDPVVGYEELEECPPELGRLPCWEENNNTYPEGLPALCADPHAANEQEILTNIFQG